MRLFSGVSDTDFGWFEDDDDGKKRKATSIPGTWYNQGISFTLVRMFSLSGCYLSTRPLWLLFSLTATGFVSSLQPTNQPTSCLSEDLLVDSSRLSETISAGRVYQHHNFLSKLQVQYLLDDIQQLQDDGKFAPSGLSNTAVNQQGFGNRDRTVCTVPWWKSLLEKGTANKATSQHPNTAASQLNQLRLQLSSILHRPTMADSTLAHECYYSCSQKGSFLPRHMDERHEELKGAKGWLLPSRRSLTWLVYLSDEDWSIPKNGGALRSFVPEKLPLRTSCSSTHEGNLQVGWWQGRKPVYLNSWYVPTDASTRDPHCVLYTVDGSNDNRIQLLTQPWLTDALQGASVADFLLHWIGVDQKAASPTLFLEKDYARNLHLLEERPLWERGEPPAGTRIEDINPERGSLVVFDSVLVPHQVEEIIKGKRLALAGWFHEETQPFPESFYEAAAV